LIYLDSSVALAELLGERIRPPEAFWQSRLVASRLLVYELWTTVHRRSLGGTVAKDVQAMLASILLIDLSPDALKRAQEPFPIALRTLDAMHLATAEFVHRQLAPKAPRRLRPPHGQGCHRTRHAAHFPGVIRS
jgi:hypothetical protein